MVKTALICLALNVYHEARGEPHLGQKAVAFVTVNRSEHKNEICDIVYATNQFSWTRNKKRKKINKDSQEWKDALELSRKVLAQKVSDPTKGATHFHNTKVKPKWRKELKKVTKIGNHIFYK